MALVAGVHVARDFYAKRHVSKVRKKYSPRGLLAFVALVLQFALRNVYERSWTEPLRATIGRRRVGHGFIDESMPCWLTAEIFSWR